MERVKYILPIIFGLCFGQGFAQDYDFSAGLVLMPFFYQNYNKYEWDSPWNSLNNPNNFNGLAAGIKFEKKINKHFSLAAEWVLSEQTQYYRFSLGGHAKIDSSGKVHITDYGSYDSYLSQNFKMFSWSKYLRYSHAIGHNSGWYLSGYSGVRLSYLLYYKDIKIKKRPAFNKPIPSSILIYTPKHFYHKVWFSHPARWKVSEGIEYRMFNKFLFGVLAGIEATKKIDDYMVSIGFRYEYDFTNSETSYYNSNPKRPKTHHIRYGLSLSAVRLF